MIEFKRDPETGQLIAYEDGVEVGSVMTLGDYINEQ